MKRIAYLLLVVFSLAAIAVAEGTLSINGAGATFPYPMYSKWFDEYHKKHANMQINYQSIGSGGGIKQVTEGTVDFGASDGPMNDEQMKAYQDKHGFAILHFPTVLGADVPTYNIPGVSAELNFTPEALAGIFLGKITKWNDPAIAEREQGRQTSRQRHRRGPPLRWQRHDLHLDRLSFQGQRGMEEQSRQGHLGELAGRTRRQGQRRRRRPGQADSQRDRLRRTDLRRSRTKCPMAR